MDATRSEMPLACIGKEFPTLVGEEDRLLADRPRVDWFSTRESGRVGPRFSALQ